jgi:hypothetical protein
MVEASVQYKAQIVSWQKRNGHVDYRIRIDAPRNISFHLNDRYSNIRMVQSTIKRQLQGSLIRNVPNFPPKKLFGNTKDVFIEDRKQRLEQFLNQFLGISKIAANEFVLVFFEQSVEPQDLMKFNELI